MIEFATQSQGLDTFLECEISQNMHLDTVGLGMLLNNRIDGLCSISDIHIDNREFIRYNISSQISLSQFFMEKMDKMRFLTILENILKTMENVEEYLLEPGMVLLEKEYIYVNVSTLRTSLIYYPIIEEKKEFNVKMFVKSIIMSMEFDSRENDNYISLLINYLNEHDNITVSQLREYIGTLKKGQTSTGMNNNYTENANNTNSFVQSPQNNMYNTNNFLQNSPSQGNVAGMDSFGQMPQNTVNATTYNQNQQGGLYNANPVTNAGQINFGQIPNNGFIQTPTQKAPEKKKGLFAGLFGNNSGDKKVNNSGKKEKNKSKGVQVAPAGIAIPGMDSSMTKNSLPEPPKPAVAAVKPQTSMAIPQPMQMGAPAPAPQPMQMGAPTPVPQPMQMGAPTPVPQPMQMGAPTPVSQPMQMGVPAPAPQPMQMGAPAPASQPNYNTQFGYGMQQDFGGTVVLGMSDTTDGATTVLSEGYNTVQRQQLPYLIRKKTNEKIEITKDLFKIGKEQTYVDYCVKDNSAVSRSHANIIKKDNEFYIIDNNSLNHTFLDGKQIPSQQMFKLEDFMVVKMADELFEFRL